MRPDEPCVHERENTFPLGRFFFLTGLPCAECAAEEYAAWEESVRERLTAGLKAADAGEAFDWNAAEPDDRPPFALVRLDDRIDLALTIDDDGRCTIPASGQYSFPRVMTMQDALDAKRDQRVLELLRHGVMTIEQAKREYGHNETPLLPSDMGEILHGLLNPQPQPGPPWTHTFRPPEPVEDENGEWYIPLGPTHTITFDTDEAPDV